MDTTRSRRNWALPASATVPDARRAAQTSHRRTLATTTSLSVLLLTLTPSLTMAQSASPAPLVEASPATADTGLSGTAWHVLNIGPTPAHLQFDQTAEFGSDGTLTVMTGCATYTGTYQAEAGGLEVAIQQVPGSATACSYSDQGLADLYRNVLGSVESWSIDENGYLVFEPNADYAGWRVGLEPVSAAVSVEATTAPSPESD